MKKSLKEIENILESESMHKFLAILIIFYVFILCLETSKCFSSNWHFIFETVDSYICVIFVIELVVRITVSRLNFFKNGWNIFDFIIITLSLIASSGIAAFRALRVFRVAEIINVSKHTKIIVNSVIKSLPILIHVFLALSIVFLLFAISAIDLFGETVPNLFGNLRESSYTLMLILIGDQTVSVIKKVEIYHQYGYIFFVVYKIIMSFVILNLFFGVIVGSLQKAINQEESVK